MDVWNDAYKHEARRVAASIIEADGYHWLADQVRKGNQPRRREVRIAMAALMVARGEHAIDLR